MPFELWARRTYEILRCEVVDGDTVYAYVDEEYPPRRRHCLRLHGLDAPETEQPWGPEATQFLANIIARSGRIYAYVVQEQDAYGRPVVILHNGDRRDSLNARIVRAGLAYAYYGNDYRDAERSARDARAGIWQQRDGGQCPWDFRREQRRRPIGDKVPPSVLIIVALIILCLFTAFVMCQALD